MVALPAWASSLGAKSPNHYGFVKTAEAVDPAGNKILFVQESQVSA